MKLKCYPDFEVFASDNKLIEAVLAAAGQVLIKMDMFQNVLCIIEKKKIGMSKQANIHL